MSTIQHETVVPMAQRDLWAENLRRIAEAPLAYCENFPSIAARHEAWWHQALADRPLFLASANSDPKRPLGRRLDLIGEPEAWLAAKKADLEQTYRVGDALPTLRVDFGPVLLGGLLGGKLEFGSDTGWTHAFIDDEWSNCPDWTLRDDNPWWKRLQLLAELVAADAPGQYLLTTPDLGGSADVMLNLRGATPLCLDALQRPETLIDAITAIYPAWHRAFSMLYDTATRHGAGIVHWLQLWSNTPYMIPACDFNFMIGPEAFNTICLPDIARQTATVGRGVFHLDGPAATVHLDALLEVPDLLAIQFVPGAGAPSALAWVDMFRRIQARGKSVIIDCPFDEVDELCAALAPEGLALSVSAPSPAALDACYAAFTKRYGGTP